MNFTFYHAELAYTLERQVVEAVAELARRTVCHECGCESWDPQTWMCDVCGDDQGGN